MALAANIRDIECDPGQWAGIGAARCCTLPLAVTDIQRRSGAEKPREAPYSRFGTFNTCIRLAR